VATVADSPATNTKQLEILISRDRSRISEAGNDSVHKRRHHSHKRAHEPATAGVVCDKEHRSSHRKRRKVATVADSPATNTKQLEILISHDQSQISEAVVVAKPCNSDSDSSAQRDHTQRRGRRRQKTAVPPVEPQTEMSTDKLENAAWMSLSEEGPMVHDLEHIVELYPHMRNCNTSTTTHLQSNGQMSSPVQVLEEEVPNPPITDVFRNIVKNLTKPQFALERDNGMSHDDLVNHLKTRRVVLPVFTAEFESQLLAESGCHVITMKSGHESEYIFPACCRGTDCVGITGLLPGFNKSVPGVVLTSMMTPEEYQVFLETKVAPRESRSCILCHRAHVTSFILSLRPNYRRVHGVSSGFSCQLYRNLCDEPGGYYKMFTLQPHPTRFEGIFDALVVFSRSRLWAFKDKTQNGRWVIDQSMMVFVDAPLLQPKVGESLQLFRKRTNDYESVCVQLQPQRLSLCRKLQNPHRLLVRVFGSYLDSLFQRHFMRVPLKLRTHAQLELTVKQLQWLVENSDVVEARCRTNGVTIGFVASIALDSLLQFRAFGTDHAQHSVGELGMFTVDELAEDMRPYALESCFWFQLRSGHIPPLVHLFSKATNQPCQKRKLPEMLMRFVRNNQYHRTLLRDMVLMVILGTYPDTDVKDRLSLKHRDHIRLRCSEQPGFIDKMVMSCTDLTLFALRRMLVHCVDDDPIYSKHVGLLCDWPAYAVAVKNTMRNLRLALNSMELLDITSVEFEGVATQVCLSAHVAILRTCYKRQRLPLLSFLHTSNRGSSGNFEFRVTDTTTNATMSRSKPTIDATIMVFLQDWIGKLESHNASLKQDVLPYLVELGVPLRATESMLIIISDYDEFRLGQRTLNNRLDHFARLFPYSFYLIQVVCMLWVERENVQVFELPQHYEENQITALQTKFEIPTTSNIIMRNRLNFHYCDVCRGVYSIIRCHKSNNIGKGRLLKSPANVGMAPPASARVKRAPKNKTFSFGYNGAVSDYFTGSLFCRLDNQIAHRRCSSQPLRSILLLGRVIIFDRQMIALCPHDSCGLPFVFCSESSIYTRQGYVCHVCSTNIRLQNRSQRMVLPLLSNAKGAQSRCGVCACILREKKACFVYPGNVLLCAKHHSLNLAEYMQRFMLVSAETCVTKMLAFRLKSYQNREQLFKKMNKAKFSHNRRVARSGNRARRG
jgi:hypothetical protein